MPLESTVTPFTSSEPPLFPSLRITEDGLIFLFTKHTNGSTPCLNNPELWTSADLRLPEVQEEYKPFYGTITLTSTP